MMTNTYRLITDSINGRFIFMQIELKDNLTDFHRFHNFVFFYTTWIYDFSYNIVLFIHTYIEK